MKKKIWIYDLEVFTNFFSGTFMNIETLKVKSFYIFKDHNDLTQIVKFLENEVSGLIGFNNVNYDYPILDFILRNHIYLSILDDDRQTANINNESRKIINSEWSAIPEKNTLIYQLDLYRIWHFDNKARRTSLKGVEFAINFENVEDFPFPVNHLVEKHEIEDILLYNLNDVKATYEFYKLSLEKIKLRRELSTKYNINLTNTADVNIGSEIFAKLIAEKKNISVWDLKKMRTYRTSIDLGDLIFPYIKFKTKEFNDVLNNFKNKTVTSLKGTLDYSLIYNGTKHNYGLGGIHSFGTPGIYESDKDTIIASCDVTSLYPNISIRNKFYPQHLGEDYCTIYEDIFNARKKIPKTNPINQAYKLMLNGSYGKSNSAYSFFYDPLYTVKTTVNGQLLLSMLVETLQLEGFKMLMVNTDGMECIVPRNKLDRYYELCYEWEDKTNLSLEFAEYDKLVLRDVNNYLAVYTDGKTKYKGALEIDKEIHKDHSQKIVKIALSKYYINGVKPEETIRNHKNIYDFCKRFRATTGWHSEYHHIHNDQKKIDTLTKNVRYYVSNKGGALLKRHDDNRLINVERGHIVTPFNKYEEKENYDINYNYYISETYKIINSIFDNQLTLF